MTTTATKTYPRAKVSRHKVLDGWVIELLLRAGAKPIKVNATYATIGFATRSALTKLGIKTPAATTAKPQPKPDRPVTAPPAPKPEQPAPVPSPQPANNCGKCLRCNHPMRPVGSKAADHPGTKLRQRKGLCQSCNNKSKSQAR